MGTRKKIVAPRKPAGPEKRKKCLKIKRENNRLTRKNLSQRQAREVQAHMHLCGAAARQFDGSAYGMTPNDIYQIASIGLHTAASRYDPIKHEGVKFSTYAIDLINGEIKHAMRDTGSLVRYPSHIHEAISKLGLAEEKLERTLQRPPTLEELAEELGVTQKKVSRLQLLRTNRKVASLDQPFSEGEDKKSGEDKRNELADDGGMHELFHKLEVREPLLRAVAGLENPAQRHFIVRLYGLDGKPPEENSSEIARRVGINPKYANRFHREGLAELAKSDALRELAGEPSLQTEKTSPFERKLMHCATNAERESLIMQRICEGWPGKRDDQAPEGALSRNQLLAIIRSPQHHDEIMHALRDLRPSRKSLIIARHGLDGKPPRSTTEIMDERDISQGAMFTEYNRGMRELAKHPRLTGLKRE